MNCSTFIPPCGRVTGRSRSSPTGTVNRSAARRRRPRSVSSTVPPQTRRHGALVLDPQRQARTPRPGWQRPGRCVTISRRSQSVWLAGQQHVAPARAWFGRHAQVMRLPVGDQDGPRHPGARFFGQRLGQRGHHAACLRRPRAVAHAARRAVRCWAAPRLRPHRGQRRLGLRGAVADALAGAVIDDGQITMSDSGARSSSCSDGLASASKQHRRRQPAQPPARQARATAPPTTSHRSQHASAVKQRPWQQRIEDQRCRSLPQPFQQRRHMHLIGFVVAGQHMHDQVDRRSDRQSRAAARPQSRARPDTAARPSSSAAQAEAQSLPPITTGVTPSFRLRKGMPSRLLGIGRRGLDPDRPRP